MRKRTLDELGELRRQLLEDLDMLKPELDEAIRVERAKGGPGATYASLMARSSYGSIEGIKQIIDPARREAMNAGRKKKDGVG
jgi:hypothetical protein